MMNLAEIREVIRSAFDVEGKKHGWVVDLQPHDGSFQLAYLILKRDGETFHEYIYTRDIAHHGIIHNGVFSYEKLTQFVQMEYKVLNDCFRIRKEIKCQS